MSKFTKYFLMEATDVIAYVQERLPKFKHAKALKCKEIGDGNLNYVFRVWDEEKNISVIVKQAGDTARISDEFKLSTNRIRIESDVLQLEQELASGLVPKVHLFDSVMNCCVMEDLSDHTILRTALINHQIFPRLADDLTTFMVNTLLLTSDVVMNHKEKKKLVKNYINPELCEITEDLVYSEPFTNHNKRNELFSLNDGWIREHIYSDKELRLEVAKRKFSFMTNAQALLHGDLHTGSVFVRKDSTKVIDPEFAFYGPMGYDIGNVMANLMFAWANADAVMVDGVEKDTYMSWLESTIIDVIDLFKKKFLEAWDIHVTEIMAKETGFDRWYLQSILEDTAAVTGLELTRRIVGLAKVKDITSIPNQESRARAERICLQTAKKFILHASEYQTGASFLQTLKEQSMHSAK
ncbi:MULTISPECIES: S-methyl-5-thioribose kinase [Bacillus cereus group]|uniref:S-methyl-5-thioribose kinase n=1 Tax=Bacillus cereus TaxID=1396 RepID=A0AA44TDA3_BACCE|nr:MULTISPECIES: S-methyl-5-thioribose kinase [Bacillus cereus group]EEL52309.1 Proton-translocating NADH-quinone oxidoreductase, chain N [Bacillus cereus Rock3-44]PFA17432.1 S-methyl-5-thioribose kinase [Bacillus cereus]PFN06765.1 S-methyl-5-thioribose kinase [Bacillus cereus]PFO82380.1 S-methyl-5-thioribose kinase [Bacillus cereus]PFR97169.1 S-methyl-5-thioribose kinase [Bacillus cereus]